MDYFFASFSSLSDRDIKRERRNAPARSILHSFPPFFPNLILWERKARARPEKEKRGTGISPTPFLPLFIWRRVHGRNGSCILGGPQMVKKCNFENLSEKSKNQKPVVKIVPFFDILICASRSKSDSIYTFLSLKPFPPSPPFQSNKFPNCSQLPNNRRKAKQQAQARL